MKNSKLFSLLIICFIATAMFAQKEDRTIITESSEPMEDIYIDDLVKRTLVEENRIIEWAPIREADIGWEKRIWRVIDTREKMNLVFRYPIEPFFEVLRTLATNDEITVFRDEAFKEPYGMDELDRLVNRVDTVSTFDYDTYEEKIEIVRSELNWEDVKQYRVKEIWFFDEELSRMRVRIIGIAPLFTETNEESGLSFTRPLFWVYYPEARAGLSKYRVFNENNDIAAKSWYDYFEDRHFASFIYKKSNALDLRTEDIYNGYDRAGIDRLLESEKIKNELFNLEHDLWEY